MGVLMDVGRITNQWFWIKRTVKGCWEYESHIIKSRWNDCIITPICSQVVLRVDCQGWESVIASSVCC